jgi:sn-glycerol 3-phosphate transport system ATP-binding protein
MKQVALRGINKVHKNGFHALKDINLEIAPGEFVVLVGPSGSGKTTLLRLVAGLEEITSGQIEIFGRIVNDLPPGERDIGMVFQDYALYPHMTVRENLSFGLEQRKLPREERKSRLDETAEMLQLGPVLDRRPAQLSGGQRQRVAIGRALVKRPKVFLFDEPLSNLDAQLRSQTRIELGNLHRRLKSTSIYVTHDQVEAMTLADRIVVLEAGRIRQVGAPMELYERPTNAFVGGFIGSPGMNFLKGELRERVFHFDGGTFSDPEAPRYTGAILLGVRPEFISLSREGDLRALVLQIEPHGHESHVFVQPSPGVTWTVRVSGVASSKRGETVGLKLEPHALHWFSAEGDKNKI